MLKKEIINLKQNLDFLQTLEKDIENIISDLTSCIKSKKKILICEMEDLLRKLSIYQQNL